MTGTREGNGRGTGIRDIVLIGCGVVLAGAALFAWTTWVAPGGTASPAGDAPVETPAVDVALASDEVILSPDAVARAGIETTPVITAGLVDRLDVTGTIEANQEQMQQVSPLLSGRVEAVAVALGDRVERGTPVVTLLSPQIAELQGGLRAAEASLAEADATLARTEQLVELGAGAGKDRIAAEAARRTAQARVVQLRQSLEALGATLPDDPDESPWTSEVVINAPISGTVVERAVNPGAWIEPGRGLLTLANLDTVWVIVNVPEARMAAVRTGGPAAIRAPAIAAVVTGRVSYVDPQIDPTTRTARVRVEVPNRQGALKLGMFVTVMLEGAPRPGQVELSVPETAIQQIGERTVVFVATPDVGRFEVRDVRVGEDVDGRSVVLEGLEADDAVVTTGGFTVKSQLLKGQFGEDESLE